MDLKKHSSGLTKIDSTELSADNHTSDCFTETVDIDLLGLTNLSDGGLKTEFIKYRIRPIGGPIWHIRIVPLESREAELVLSVIRGHGHYWYDATIQKSSEGHHELVHISIIEPTYCYEDDLKDYQRDLSRRYPFRSSIYLEGKSNSESKSYLHDLLLKEINSDNSINEWFHSLSEPKVDIGKIVFVHHDSPERSRPEEGTFAEYKKKLSGEKSWTHFITAGFTDAAKLLLEAVTGDTSAIYRIISAKNQRGLYDIVDIQPIDACDLSLSNTEMLKLLFPEDK